MELVGTSADAYLQVMSKPIPLRNDRSHLFSFWFRSDAPATLDLRYSSSGYVFSLKSTEGQWLSLADGLKNKKVSLLHYTRGLGKSMGRESADISRLTFSPGIESATIVARLQGTGAFTLDDVELVANEKVPEVLKEKTADGERSIEEMELERLLVNTNERSAKLKPLSNKNLIIQDVVLPESYLPRTNLYPKKATGLRIKGNSFYVGDKPAFLFGVESSMSIYPWLYRILGVDFVHIEDALTRSVMQIGGTNHDTLVSWTPYEWLEICVHHLLQNGMGVYIQPREENYNNNVQLNPLYADFPELFVNASHFIEYRFEGQAQRIRENNWKAILQTTRRFPIFAYELYNEVSYNDYDNDYDSGNIGRFRTSMKEKFKTLDTANAAWGTTFKSFDDVQPPRTSLAQATHASLKPADFSVNLWVDWQKFIEAEFGQHLGKLKTFVRSVEKNSNVYLTVQATANIGQGYRGGSGVFPKEKIKSEDFFGHELGAVYISQEGAENPQEIRSMIQTLLSHDVAAQLSPDKPIMDEESKVTTAARFPLADSRLVDLHGSWQFMADNAREGEKKGYHRMDFNENGWSAIQVPGLWGSQGFPECTHGWYRKTFRMPVSAKGKKIFLNGFKITDVARIYLNDTLVKQTASWNEKFGVEVGTLLRSDRENVLSISIENNYRSANMYWGGIREYLSLDDRNYSLKEPLQPGQMRSYLWEKLVHGKSGAIMSYAYTPEGQRISMFNPRDYSLESIKAIPKIKKEFETVADIFFPRTTGAGLIGLYYPFESGRASVPESIEKWIAAPPMKDLADVYMAVLFNHVPMDVISRDTILENMISGYRAIVFAGAPRVGAGVFENLTQYVSRGGILFIDHGSILTNDDTHAPLTTETLTGVKPLGEIREARSIDAKKMLGQNIFSSPNQVSGSAGRDVELVDATAVLRYENGKPALTQKKLGSGFVYYFAAHLGYDEREKIYASLLNFHKIEGRLRVMAPPGGRFIEAHVFESKGRSVLYAHNWGGGLKSARLCLNGARASGYSIRNVSTGLPLEGKKSWTPRELEEGLPVALPSQDPLALLLEPIDGSQTDIKSIGHIWSEKLAYLRTSPAAATRVLVSAGKNEDMTKIRMLTAVRLLEENGFQVNSLLDKVQTSLTTDVSSGESLDSYQVFVTLGRARFSEEEIALIKQFVSKGGSLLASGNLFVGPHGWLDNPTRMSKLTSVFGLPIGNRNIRDEGSHLEPSSYLAHFTPSLTHPLTAFVKTFTSFGMTGLPSIPAEALAILRSGPGASPPNEPVLAAREYGQGRIVVMGGASWMEPTLLSMADNAQLCMNLFLWLARKEASIAPITPSQRTLVTNATLSADE